MKTNLIFSFLVVLTLFFFIGCSSDNDADNTSAADLPTVKLTAGYVDDYSTRTVMDATYNILWYPGDVINVNGQLSTNTAVSNAGLTASFDVAATPTYYAFYPTGMVSSFDETAHTFAVTLPATQTYKNAISFSDNVNPAVAVSENSYLSFYNVCGILRVPINTNLVAVKARFLSMDQTVSGSATVDPSAKTLTVATDGGKTVDITSLPTTSTYTLTWVLPVGTYGAGWRIQLLDAGGNLLAEKVSPEALTITRGHMNLVGSALSLKKGIFSAGLYWAKGNLYAPTIASPYQFAAAQETFINTSVGGYYFGWNTLNSQTTSSTNPTAAWIPTDDPCAKVVPAGSWRTPTNTEFTNLLNTGSVWATKNTIPGCYFGTTALPVSGAEENYVFLPAMGSRASANTTVSNVGTSGNYWSATPNGTANVYGLTFSLAGGASVINNMARALGVSSRCVSDR